MVWQKKEMKILLVLFCYFAVFMVQPTYGSANYNTGFRTVGVWLQDSGLRLDMNIWYPTLRKTHDYNFTPWILKVALNAKPANGKFPLLVLSHASPGTRFSYHYLGAFFAEHGFIVISPTHPTDSMENMDDMFTWRQLEKRVKELQACLDMILKDSELSPDIDKTRVGFIGFGSGATAGLLLAGALPNCNSWASYCTRAALNDPYCTEWARGKIKIMCDSLAQNSMRDTRFKAIALIAPAYGMLFDFSSFPDDFPPVLLVGSGKDMFNKFELHCEPIARILGKKAHYLHLPNADATALMNECPPGLENELPELCNSVSMGERKKLHYRLEIALQKFFLTQMGN